VIGYHSKPDADGVRYFVSFYRERAFAMVPTFHAVFGLDVPCDQLTKYTEDIVEVIDELRSPDGQFCRISALSFTRMD
jgi:hypothetical protein